MSRPTSSVPGARRRGRPGTDAETVLRTAITLFNERGYDHTSMGDLAEALGLTKSAIYHHVASKESLLAAALDEALDALVEVVRAPAGGSAGERLRTTIHSSVEILVAHQPAVTLLLRVRGNSPVEVAALDRRREIDAQLAALVSDAISAGELRSDLDPLLVSRLLFGMVNSLVEWWRPGGPTSAVELADAVTAIAFDGLRDPAVCP
ncbi:MAG: TetR/AcrR family transcriptional regulator [Nocardioides sp.]|jgi:AcrR family transcriptional regulator